MLSLSKHQDFGVYRGASRAALHRFYPGMELAQVEPVYEGPHYPCRVFFIYQVVYPARTDVILLSIRAT